MLLLCTHVFLYSIKKKGGSTSQGEEKTRIDYTHILKSFTLFSNEQVHFVYRSMKKIDKEKNP